MHSKYSFLHKTLASFLAATFFLSNIAFADPDISYLSAQSRLSPFDEALRTTSSAERTLWVGARSFMGGSNLRDVQARVGSGPIQLIDYSRPRTGPLSVVFTPTTGPKQGRTFEFRYSADGSGRPAASDAASVLQEESGTLRDGDYYAILQRPGLEERYAPYLGEFARASISGEESPLLRVMNSGLVEEPITTPLSDKKKKMVIFGAGVVGRGFFAELFRRAGYEIILIDIDDALVDEVKKNRSYPLYLIGRQNRKVIIPDVTAFHSKRDIDDIVKAVEDADILALSVPPVEEAVSDACATVVRCLEGRLNAGRDTPIDIILASNEPDPTKLIHKRILEAVSDPVMRQRIDDTTGIVGTVVGRMMPKIPADVKAVSPSAVFGEEYSILPVDKGQFKGEFPEDVKGLEPYGDLAALERRKLYIHNCGHAVASYLGHLKGYTYIYEAVRDGSIKEIVEGALHESALALEAEYRSDPDFEPEEMERHISDLVDRFDNEPLADSILRVGGDQIRKLRKGDRLVGPALNALQYGIEPVYLAKAIAAAIVYDNPEDPKALEVQAILNENGPEAVLQKLCGIDINGDNDNERHLGRLVLNEIELLKAERDQARPERDSITGGQDDEERGRILDELWTKQLRKEAVQVRVTEVVQKDDNIVGLSAEYCGIRCFVPASFFRSVGYMPKDLFYFVGKELNGTVREITGTVMRPNIVLEPVFGEDVLGVLQEIREACESGNPIDAAPLGEAKSGGLLLKYGHVRCLMPQTLLEESGLKAKRLKMREKKLPVRVVRIEEGRGFAPLVAPLVPQNPGITADDLKREGVTVEGIIIGRSRDREFVEVYLGLELGLCVIDPHDLRAVSNIGEEDRIGTLVMAKTKGVINRRHACPVLSRKAYIYDAFRKMAERGDISSANVYEGVVTNRKDSGVFVRVNFGSFRDEGHSCVTPVVIDGLVRKWDRDIQYEAGDPVTVRYNSMRIGRDEYGDRLLIALSFAAESAADKARSEQLFLERWASGEIQHDAVYSGRVSHFDRDGAAFISVNFGDAENPFRLVGRMKWSNIPRRLELEPGMEINVAVEDEPEMADVRGGKRRLHIGLRYAGEGAAQAAPPTAAATLDVAGRVAYPLEEVAGEVERLVSLAYDSGSLLPDFSIGFFAGGENEGRLTLKSYGSNHSLLLKDMRASLEELSERFGADTRFRLWVNHGTYEANRTDLDTIDISVDESRESISGTQMPIRIASVSPRSVERYAYLLEDGFKEAVSGYIGCTVDTLVPGADERVSSFSERVRAGKYDACIIQLHGAKDEEAIAFEDFGRNTRTIVLVHRPEEILLRYPEDQLKRYFAGVDRIVLLGDAMVGRYKDMFGDKVVSIPHGFFNVAPEIPQKDLNIPVIGSVTTWSDMRWISDVVKLVKMIKDEQPQSRAVGYIAGKFVPYTDPGTGALVDELQALRESPDCAVIAAANVEAAYVNSEFSDLASFKRWLYKLSGDGSRVVIVDGSIRNEAVKRLQSSLVDFNTQLYREILNSYQPKVEYSGTLHENPGSFVPVVFESASMNDVGKAEAVEMVAVPVSASDSGEPQIDYKVAARAIVALAGDPDAYAAMCRHNRDVAGELTMDRVAGEYLRIVRDELIQQRESISGNLGIEDLERVTSLTELFNLVGPYDRVEKRILQDTIERLMRQDTEESLQTALEHWRTGRITNPATRQCMIKAVRDISIHNTAVAKMPQTAQLVGMGLDDEDRLVRATAVKAAGIMGLNGLSDKMRHLMANDPVRQIRERSMIALGLMGDRRMADPIRSRLQDRAFSTRHDMLWANAALVVLGDRIAARFIEYGLVSDSKDICAEAKSVKRYLESKGLWRVSGGQEVAEQGVADGRPKSPSPLTVNGLLNLRSAKALPPVVSNRLGISMGLAMRIVELRRTRSGDVREEDVRGIAGGRVYDSKIRPFVCYGSGEESRDSISGTVTAARQRYPRPLDAHAYEAAVAIKGAKVDLFVPQTLFPNNSFASLREKFGDIFAGSVRPYQDFSHLASMLAGTDPAKACVLLVGCQGVPPELRKAIKEDQRLTQSRFINVEEVDIARLDQSTRTGYYERVLGIMSLARSITQQDIDGESSAYIMLRYYLHSHLPKGASVEDYLNGLVRPSTDTNEFLSRIAGIIKAILSYKPSSPYTFKEIRATTQVLWAA